MEFIPFRGEVVVAVDAKSGIQALDRTQPLLTIDFGKTQKRTFDYARMGTTQLKPRRGRSTYSTSLIKKLGPPPASPQVTPRWPRVSNKAPRRADATRGRHRCE